MWVAGLGIGIGVGVGVSLTLGVGMGVRARAIRLDSTKWKLRLLDCGLGGLRGGVSLRAFASTLPRLLLPVLPPFPRPLFQLALSNSGMALASPRPALPPASFFTISARAMLRKGERGDRGEVDLQLMERTVLRLRLRLHQRQITVRRAARKTREPRVMPPMAPPGMGQRERVEGFEGRLVDACSVVDAIVALTSAVYSSLYLNAYRILEHRVKQRNKGHLSTDQRAFCSGQSPPGGDGNASTVETELDELVK